jgi:hypothetical protein
MREIRPSGSEGGAAQSNAPSLPLSERRSPAMDHHAVVETAVAGLPGVPLRFTPGSRITSMVS